MNIQIQDLRFSATEADVKRAFAAILHEPPFYERNAAKARKLNFDVQLGKPRNGLPNDGTAIITIPDREIGERFARAAVRAGGERIRILGKPVYLTWGKVKPPSKNLVERLNKTPYVDPDIETQRIRKLEIIRELRILVDAVQFGVFFHHPQDRHPSFSIEHEIRQEDTYVGELTYDYNRKLLRIELGHYIRDDTSNHIVVDIRNLKSSSYSKDDDGKDYLYLELWATPRFEQQYRYRHRTGVYKKDRQFRERLPHLGGEHEQINHYAFQLRLALTEREGYKDLRRLCKEAEILLPIAANIPVEYSGFFTPEELRLSRAWIDSFEWPVCFQLEALLRNGLVNTGDLYLMSNLVTELVQEQPDRAADFLRRFSEQAKSRKSSQSVLKCFQDALVHDRSILQLTGPVANAQRTRGFVQCAHAVVTPTRILLEGPYDTQSNRIVRKYFDYRDNFIRVEFREENRMSFYWPIDVDGKSLIKQRFGEILKKGFEIAGRHFRFLGYSTSGLRQHSAWFMSEFEHPDEGLVTVDGIRDGLGTFESCIRIPSKYAARIAQAFSGTHPSVRITRGQWDDTLKDLGKKPYEHTDGQGIISKDLRDLIWDVLIEAWPDRQDLVLKPSAFQFRFLGFKGIVVVDEHLEGIYMRLRPSMHKFKANEKDEQEAEIEVAKAYSHPGEARLCRPLVAVLEDLGVRKEEFIRLQEVAKAVTITAGDTIASMAKLLKANDLGNVFGLHWILSHLEKAGMRTRKEQQKKPGKPTMDDDFILRLIKFAQTYLLREFKHDARIPIKDAHQLVGVVDEGPAWLADGVKDVFLLGEGQIFACVQKPDKDEPEWIEGLVTISRSPHIHPGDVQQARAIGKPPDGVPCFYRNLRNVVVMPSVGERSLASMLGGGDVDGDEFLVIKDTGLLPLEHHEPANYEGVKPIELDQDSTIDNVCDFVVEYMHSDVMGLVADLHLRIADQSKDGVRDPDCMKLAQLCSQAVDYPKNGVQVQTDDLPEPYLRAKPDWKKKEDDDGRPGDYYESPRALGELFRNIDVGTFKVPPSSYPNDVPLTPIWEEPLSDNISKALKSKVEQYLERVENDEAHIADVEPLFRLYARELAYVCLTHAPSENTDVRLSEEEVTLGVILAQCSQRRWKKDRMHRMREHVGQWVRNIKGSPRGLGVPHAKEKGKGEEARREELLAALAKGWAVWDFGRRHRNKFGASSFSLIGLGVVCGMLDRVEVLDTAAKVARSASK